MKSGFFRKSLALVLVVFFVNALCFQERAMASGGEKNGKNPSQPTKLSGWRDNSPKGTSLMPVLLVGAAVVGAFIIIKVSKKDNNADEKDNGQDKEENKGNASLQSGSFSELNSKLAYSSDSDLKLQPYFVSESFNDGSMKLQPMGKSFQFGILITF